MKGNLLQLQGPARNRKIQGRKKSEIFTKSSGVRFWPKFGEGKGREKSCEVYRLTIKEPVISGTREVHKIFLDKAKRCP
ncbi:hypothetical protein K1719_000377 [Acacia pycnantha]|nr:hypothetical protein K1719_000377 [Acacia pycnantha]